MKVWGLLAGGQLHYHILPEGENMNSDRYEWLIRHKFCRWSGKHDLLVQDYERCLRSDVALDAMKEAGLALDPGLITPSTRKISTQSRTSGDC